METTTEEAFRLERAKELLSRSLDYKDIESVKLEIRASLDYLNELGE